MNRLASRMIVLCLVGFLAACAVKKKPERPKLPPGSREPPITAPQQEETPERRASNALVEEGQTALGRGQYDQAADLFQESVTVDPTNGAGYYYLALVRFKTGEYGEAWDFLEKAETLLPSDPEWLERIELLKRDLTAR